MVTIPGESRGQMKLHPGVFRQVHSMMKKASHRELVEQRQWSGRSEELRGLGARSSRGHVCLAKEWVSRSHSRAGSKWKRQVWRAMPGAPFLDLLGGALRASWRLRACHYSKLHRTVR